jgi:hypothetical protein
MNLKDGLRKLLPEKDATKKEIANLQKEIEERKRKIAMLKNNEKIGKLQKRNEKLGGS